MKDGMTVEYLKCRADLNFEVDFRVNDIIGTIATKWDLILFRKSIVFIQHPSNSPMSPPNMTNPRLPKPLIHSPPTPPTPPPAKQIHISYKTPSPGTTPRISITTRMPDAAEPPVPVSLPSATNTQVTLNITIATPTATALPTQTQHMDRVVPYFDMTRTIRTAHTTSIHKPSSNNERNLIILQANINGINNKLEELKTLIKTRMQTSS